MVDSVALEAPLDDDLVPLSPDPVEVAVRNIWSDRPGIGMKELMIEVSKMLVCEPSGGLKKKRVKAAKSLLPYTRVLPDLPDAPNGPFDKESFVLQQLDRRQSHRIARRFKESDDIERGLSAMGIVLNDNLKTWRVGPKPDLSPAPLSMSILNEVGIPCEMCGRSFFSRNLVFQHLRDPASGCGNSIFSAGLSLAVSPSAEKRTAKREARHRGRKTGATAKHADKKSCLWMGDLPLPWTRAGGKYRLLRALLFAHTPRGVPQPWIKTVVRKGYRPLRSRIGESPTNGDGDGEGDGDGDKRGGSDYLGYAIVVYRDEREAAEVMSAMDGVPVSAQTVFGTDRLEAECTDSANPPPFRLKVRPVDNSDTAAAAVPEHWRRESVGDGANTALKPGLDPPLAEQLRPLAADALRRRALRYRPRCQNEPIHSKVPTKAPRTHEEELTLTLSVYRAAGIQTRSEVPLRGRPVPANIREPLLHMLETLRWPAQNQRQGLSAERYLVLQSNVTNDPYYSHLRDACQDLMAWAGPHFYYSGIAVTKNLVASPHIDDRDQSYQYALSLGHFTKGGELCVEGGGGEGCKDDWVNVVETHNCMARLDGRHVHWVRTWEGGDRYSLIFYDTSDRQPMPVNKNGVYDIDDHHQTSITLK